MKLTTKSRTAINAMIELGLSKDDLPVSLGLIGDRHKVSRTHLESLMLKLKRQGLVRSYRGVGGGYTLAEDPGLISISEIIIAIDGPEQCSGSKFKGQKLDDNDYIGRNEFPVTGDLWLMLNDVALKYLSGIKLDSLIKRNNSRLFENN